MRRLVFGSVLAAVVGGTLAVAQSSITPTKPLTSPGINTTPAFPSAPMWKNSPSPGGSGLGLGAQSVPGISPVTNPQASKGGSDAEQINRTEQKTWLPQNFRLSLPGTPAKVNKVDEVKKKQSVNPDAVGAARDFAKPPSINKKGGGDSVGLNFKSGTPKTMEFELMFDLWESSAGPQKQKTGPLESGLGGGSQDKSKFGTWGPGYTPDKSSSDKSKFGTWGPGYTPDKSSNDKSQFGTWGPGYTPDKSSNDKSQFGTWGPGYTPDKSSSDKSQFGTWGPGYTPDKSSTDKSKFGTWGPGYTPDKSSSDKSKFGTWGSGYTPDKSSKDGSDNSSKGSSTGDSSKTEKQEGKNEPSQ